MKLTTTEQIMFTILAICVLVIFFLLGLTAIDLYKY